MAKKKKKKKIKRNISSFYTCTFVFKTLINWHTASRYFDKYIEGTKEFANSLFFSFFFSGVLLIKNLAREGPHYHHPAVLYSI